MIKKYATLNGEQERAVRSLISECAAYDLSGIPIQFDHSLNYFPEMASWFLCFEEEVLTGILSIFNPLAEIAEISGCVKPGKRNKGRFKELIAASCKELSSYNVKKVLFVVDNNSKTGMGIAERSGLQCNHTEYLMQYGSFAATYNFAIQVRAAEKEDIPDFIRINTALFHETCEESENMIRACLQSKDRKQYMAAVDDETIGICTLFYDGQRVIIYGLGISESHQGKGYGYHLINAVFDMLKDTRYELELEVDSLNEKAYNLYRKAGFKETSIVHYYEKELTAAI